MDSVSSVFLTLLKGFKVLIKIDCIKFADNCKHMNLVMHLAPVGCVLRTNHCWSEVHNQIYENVLACGSVTSCHGTNGTEVNYATFGI